LRPPKDDEVTAFEEREQQHEVRAAAAALAGTFTASLAGGPGFEGNASISGDHSMASS